MATEPTTGPDAVRYLEQIRNLTRFIAIVVGIFAAASLVFVILGYVELTHVFHAVSGVAPAVSNCDPTTGVGC